MKDPMILFLIAGRAVSAYDVGLFSKDRVDLFAEHE